ncbi:unnamed protein product, partial [Timema podura]|nr:unnamed protein product [Timema podura]
DSGSDIDVRQKTKKKQKSGITSGSDGEQEKGSEEEGAEPSATAEALFGDADDISTDEDEQTSKKSDDGRGSDQEKERRFGEDGEELRPVVEE